MRCQPSLLCASWLLGIASTVQAVELTVGVPSDQSASPILDELPLQDRARVIAGWINQLESQRFTDRQAARRLLSGAGVDAIPLLEQATKRGSRETSTTALELLDELHHSPSLEARSQAEETLRRISEQGGDSAGARLAARILSGPSDSEFIPRSTFAQRNGMRRLQARQGRMFQIGGRVQIGGGNAPAGGLQIMRMNVQNQNGVRTITVNENGQKVTIEDDPNKGIEITVTRTVEGRNQTTRYRVANLEELKQKHPEAAQLYKKYSRQGPLIIPPAPQPAADEEKP